MINIFIVTKSKGRIWRHEVSFVSLKTWSPTAQLAKLLLSRIKSEEDMKTLNSGLVHGDVHQICGGKYFHRLDCNYYDSDMNDLNYCKWCRHRWPSRSSNRVMGDWRTWEDLPFQAATLASKSRYQALACWLSNKIHIYKLTSNKLSTSFIYQ